MSAALSVVVPFYQAEDTIGACIEALLEQEGVPSYEILLVDNRATDRSADIVRSYDDPRLRLLVESKQGAYAARNRGLEEAEGETILFTDPDCVPEPRWLERLTQPLVDPEIGIVMGRVLPGRPSPALELLSAYEALKEALVLGSGVADMYFGRTSNMAVRRELLSIVGPFVERKRGSDTLFVRAAVSRLGASVLHYSPDARVRHLEIEGLDDHLRKVFIYARSSKTIGERIRGPSRSRRLELASEACRTYRFANVRRLQLLSILALEGIAWRLGEVTAGRRARAVESPERRSRPRPSHHSPDVGERELPEDAE